MSRGYLANLSSRDKAEPAKSGAGLELLNLEAIEVSMQHFWRCVSLDI